MEDRFSDRVLLALAGAGVAVAIGLRIWNRGDNVPGWDLMLGTEGQYLLATRGWWGALRETMVQTRYFWLAPAAYSVPYGLVPGALTLAMPWLFWQPLVVGILWLVTLALFVRAAGWPLNSCRGVGIALLAWGVWPAGLSYAVEGYPWAGCLLPYAVALAVVLHPRIRRSIPLTVLGAALAYELPWHTYELAKTVGCVFALAALLERDVRWPVRALWALTAVIQIGDAFWFHQSTNVLVFRHGNTGAGVGIQHALPYALAGAAEVLRQVYVTRVIALPVLTTAAVMSLFLLREHRWFLTALWLGQLGLFVLLAASGADLLRARRFLVVEGMSFVVVLAGLRTAPAVARGALVACLLAGNAWALWDLAVFIRHPPPLIGFSLPGVASPEGVGLVDFASVRWARELEARARAGERVVLLHSQWCPTESVTNPSGVLERLYLALGHERFVRSVTALAVPCRYVCLPLPSEAEFPAHVATLAPGQRIDLDETCKKQMAPQWTVLQKRFGLTPSARSSGRFLQLVLREREGAGP